jgi:hypothetical protein
MRDIDPTLVHDAAVFLMGYTSEIPEARSLLKVSGMTAKEIELAEKVATNNLFSFVFHRKWTDKGQMVVPTVIGKA